MDRIKIRHAKVFIGCSFWARVSCKTIAKVAVLSRI
jgi:hypothetical protein